MRLKDRIALVTGASRGIGRAIAIEFAREGADIAVNYRKQAAAAEETATVIRDFGRRAVVLPADISDAEACRRMVAEAESALGPLDITVANGGVASRPGMIADLPVEEWHRVLATDLHGCFYTIKAVIGGMLERGLGLRHHAPALLGVGDVALDDHGAPAEVPDDRGGLLRGRRLLPVVDGDVGALAGELDRDRAPDPARRARDESDAVLQSHRSTS